MGTGLFPNWGRIGRGVSAARRHAWIGWIQASIFLLAACAGDSPLLPTPLPQPTSSPPAFVTAPAAEALPQLVAAERAAAGAKDLALLAQLWVPEARIVDSRGTADPADDYVWQGKAALLDRYTLAVFPNPPPPFATPPVFEPTIIGNEATAELGQDRWQFFWQEGRWWLAGLGY